METRSRSGLAMGLGLVFWMFLLFSPLAWVGQAQADDTDNYGTVIGIVSLFEGANLANCSRQGNEARRLIFASVNLSHSRD